MTECITLSPIVPCPRKPFLGAREQLVRRSTYQNISVHLHQTFDRGHVNVTTNYGERHLARTERKIT